ncbi:MAG: membrane protein insertase YidC, partial [Ottowia sp.]|nr:membrane protein insertase YidC [Ottowia sp.]
MNDIRRTILWVIFAFSLVMLWDQWQVHNGKKPTFFPSSAPAASASAPASAAPSASAAASDVPSSTQAGTAAAAPAGAVPTGATPALPRERVDISTDVLKLTFDTEGGTIVHSQFLKYGETDHQDRPFVLLDTSANRV